MAKPSDVEQRTWDALKVAVFRRTIERMIDEALTGLQHIDADVSSRLREKYRLRVLREVGLQATSAIDPEIAEVVAALDILVTSAAREAIDIETLMHVRDEVRRDVQGNRILQFLLRDLENERDRVANLAAIQGADIPFDRRDDELVDLKSEVAELRLDLETLKHTRYEYYDQGRSEVQHDVRAFVYAQTLKLDLEQLRIRRFLPIRVFAEGISESIEEEIISCLNRVCESVEFQQAEP